MFAIFGKAVNPKHYPSYQFFFDCLKELKMDYQVEEKFAAILVQNNIAFNQKTYRQFDSIAHEIEMLMTLGGDGTILEAITFIQRFETPILGINFGRLGFLANVGKEELKNSLELIDKGKYIVENRSLLSLNTNKGIFANCPFALNEMTIQRKDQSSMITIHTYLNGELLNSYWADGLIIATPSGSTGYSLSCGGPILYPSSDNFVITPVAPHNLNVRPIVVADDVVLSFEVTGRNDSFLCTLDSRFESIDSSVQIAIKKADFGVKLIRLSDANFISALKTKLFWGLDGRN